VRIDKPCVSVVELGGFIILIKAARPLDATTKTTEPAFDMTGVFACDCGISVACMALVCRLDSVRSVQPILAEKDHPFVTEDTRVDAELPAPVPSAQLTLPGQWIESPTDSQDLPPSTSAVEISHHSGETSVVVYSANRLRQATRVFSSRRFLLCARRVIEAIRLYRKLDAMTVAARPHINNFLMKFHDDKCEQAFMYDSDDQLWLCCAFAELCGL
jgi:hypothetical protein